MTTSVALPIRLTETERSPKSIQVESTLADAIEAFYADSDLRLLPVLDSDGHPLGAIFERDVRRLLINPYGHALLRNRYYSRNLASHLRECPTAEVTRDIGALVEHYRRCDGREGMILTLGESCTPS